MNDDVTQQTTAVGSKPQSKDNSNSAQRHHIFRLKRPTSKVEMDMKKNLSTQQQSAPIAQAEEDVEVAEERTVSSVREIAQQFGALYQPLFAVKPVSKKSIANNITTKNDSADDECVKNEKKTMTKKFHKSLPKHRIKGIKSKTSGEPTMKSNSSTPSADYSTATIDSDKPDQSIIRDSEVQSTYGISKLSDKNVETDKVNRSVVESDKNKISNNNAFDNDMKDDDLNAEKKCDTQENEQCFESNYDNLKCSDDVALPSDISEDNRGITENLHKNNPDESEEEEEDGNDKLNEVGSNCSSTSRSDNQTTSESCALIGCAYTDLESICDDHHIIESIAEKDMKNTTQNRPVPPKRSNRKMDNTSSSPRRVQKFIVKKKRSIECFADAQMQRKSETEIGGIQSKSASKTLIMSDPQNISVSATVSLGVKNDVDLLKIAECRLKSTSDDVSKALHSTASQLHKAQPQQAIIQKANITNVDATQNCPRPILVVHPAQKCFSHTAIRTFKTLADSSTNDNTTVNTIIQLNGDEINDAEDDKKVSVDDCIGDAVNGKHFKTTDKIDNIDGNITISDNNGIDANNNNNNDAKSTTKYESHAPVKSTNPSITKFTLSKGLFSVPSRFSRDTKKELTFEVTEASSDRLQKWKSKLQTGRRHKDTSEPPPIIRNMLPVPDQTRGHSSDAEVTVEWAPSGFVPLQSSSSQRFLGTGNVNKRISFVTQIMRPRLLQPSRSSIDVMSCTQQTRFTDRFLNESSSGGNDEPMKVQELVMKKKRSNEAFAETKSLFERTTAGEGSAGSGTATRADAGIGTQIKTVSLTDSQMEHRTLKYTTEDVSTNSSSVTNSKSSNNLLVHFQNMENLQHLVQTIDVYDNVTNSNLPPPVRITPFSGMKPQDSDIIRPVAFRPCLPKKCGETVSRQSITSSSFYTNTISDDQAVNQRQSSTRLFNEPNPRSVPLISLNSSISRPRTIYQPSTSGEPSTSYPPPAAAKYNNSNNPTSTTKLTTKSEIEENDYDVVPEYLDVDRDQLYSDGGSDNYSLLYQSPPVVSSQNAITVPSSCSDNQKDFVSQSNINHNNNNNFASGNNFNSFPVNSVNISTNITKKSSSSHHIYHGSTNTSTGSRNSSGIHVTPSPSDSGIVDYESIIRDKENELTTVRNTMEQNEEIIIRVYQEKEKIWKEQLADLKQKLQASQQGENALRQQIQRCNEQREQFQTTIQNLNCDKQGLQRKCVQIEREMFQIRERFDEMLRNRPSSSECDHCKRFSSNVDFDRNRSKPSLPLSAPKQKDSSCTNDELRLEVEQLRGEISTLRETLNEQIGMFGDERRRWEMERNKMLQLNPSNLNPSLSVYSNRSKPPPSSAISTQQKQQCVVSADQLI